MTNTNVRKKVLVADSIASAAIDVLRRDADVDVRIGLTPAELLSAIGGYEGLIVRSQTKVTRQIIDAGGRLEVIGRAGVGVDNIDVDAATRRGVFVINSREGNTVSAAEHTIAILLSLVRHIPKADRDLRAGLWNRSLKGIEMRSKVLGIIGLGRVGTAVAEIARGFRINVIAYDPMVSQAAADRLGVQMVEMDALLGNSDFISVHVPLGPATKGLIGREQIGRMKPTAMVVNCARGGVIDEQALYDALEEGPPGRRGRRRFQFGTGRRKHSSQERQGGGYSALGRVYFGGRDQCWHRHSGADDRGSQRTFAQVAGERPCGSGRGDDRG